MRALGATPVPYGDGLAMRLRELAPDGADAALDASGHGELPALIELCGGPERVLTIASSAEAQQLGVTFHAGGGGELTLTALGEVLALIEAGSFSFPIAGVYDLGQVGEALRESEHGHPAGKLVVVPVGAGQTPRGVERDPPAPVGAARVDRPRTAAAARNAAAVARCR